MADPPPPGSPVFCFVDMVSQGAVLSRGRPRVGGESSPRLPKLVLAGFWGVASPLLVGVLPVLPGPLLVELCGAGWLRAPVAALWLAAIGVLLAEVLPLPLRVRVRFVGSFRSVELVRRKGIVVLRSFWPGAGSDLPLARELRLSKELGLSDFSRLASPDVRPTSAGRPLPPALGMLAMELAPPRGTMAGGVAEAREVGLDEAMASLTAFGSMETVVPARTLR